MRSPRKSEANAEARDPASAGLRIKLPLDELVNRIALDIQSGLFGPGTWLQQVDLEARYEGTRIDRRRALDRLVANRLEEHVHNRG